MVSLKYFLSPLILTIPLLGGESRNWTNAEGTKHFDAEFVSREANQVTLVHEDGKELSFDLEMLHEDDRKWLNMNHPVEKEGEVVEMPPENAIFDTLVFGDSRDEVSEKLKASKFVSSGVAGVFQGRTGMNGIYHTKHKIGGLLCYLFFDWDESGRLQEVTLQTENQTAGSYDDVLKPCWEECIPLISSIHGKALQSTNIPAASVLEDGQMLASHLWKIEHGGTVMLGTAKQGQGYQVVVRFTKEKIEINATP